MLEHSIFLGHKGEQTFCNGQKFLVWDRTEWNVDSVASFIIPSCVTLGESVDAWSSWDNDRVHLTCGETESELAHSKNGK